MGPINGRPINLKSAGLQGTVLRFATLSAADLEAADMSGADLMHARFDQANLRAANLSNALLDHADFAAANLANVNLCGASLSFAILSTADLEAADMSGADLMHARFDQANLRAANLSNALLDHADFAGANLANANLCGARLFHAKNITEAQLEETIGSDSTILPPHLRGSVPWSVARSLTETAALERRDLRPRAQNKVHLDVSHTSSYNRPAWIAGVLLIGGALVATGFVWQWMNEAVPLDTSGAQRGSEQPLSKSKLSHDIGEQRLQPSVPEAPMEEKAAAERRQSADAELPTMPSAASPIDRTETALEQGPAPKADSATVPQETNAHAELQASDGAKWSGKDVGPNEQAPGTADEGHEPKSNEAAETSPLVSAESSVATSRHGTVPDLPAEASIPNPRFSPAIEAPAAALALSIPEPSAPSSMSDPLPPPVVTAPLPSSLIQRDVQTALPPSTEAPPTPVRNPARLHRAKGQSSIDKQVPAVRQKDLQTVSPASKTPPTPAKNPARALGATGRQEN
jgi:hypothetical protein